MRTVNGMREFFAAQGLDLGDGALVTKSMHFTPTVDRKNRLVKGLVSTSSLDLDGEVVLQNFDTSYFPEQVKAVYLDHQYVIPGQVAAVGTCRSLSKRGDGLFAVTHVRDTPLGNDVLDAIEEGALGGFSIGFQVKEGGPATEEERELLGLSESTNVIRAAKLLEYSFTSMPANADALMKMLPRLSALSGVLALPARKGRHIHLGGDGVAFERTPA